MKFNKPELNIVRFDAADVIATSEAPVVWTVGGSTGFYGLTGLTGVIGGDAVLFPYYEASGNGTLVQSNNVPRTMRDLLPQTITYTGSILNARFDIMYNGSTFNIVQCTDSGNHAGTHEVTNPLDFANLLRSIINAGN